VFCTSQFLESMRQRKKKSMRKKKKVRGEELRALDSVVDDYIDEL
jgi:hypothetical protein